MFACSLTVLHHLPELLAFIQELAANGVGIINSAVFHSGFLTGGTYFDYRQIDENDDEDKRLIDWRERFFTLCEEQGVTPARACVQFGMSFTGVVSTALNTGNPKRIKENVESTINPVPVSFWRKMEESGLLEPGVVPES